MRGWLVVGMLLGTVGCSRSFDAPPPATPGTIYGRAVVQLDATGTPTPAEHALVKLLGSSVVAFTGSDGRFLLDGITATRGTLVFELDVDGDGTADRRSALTLESLHAGPGRQIDTGDVVIAKPASVRGRVRRGDALDSPGGNGGAVIFVPQGPFSTTSADDGSFLLGGLPQGDVTLSVFLAGYQPLELGTVTLRGGELFTVDDVVLTPRTGPAPLGSLDVDVELAPSGSLAGSGVSLTAPGQSFTTTTDGQGHARFNAAPEAVYTLVAHHDGYTDATVPNVVVLGGVLATVQVTLGTTPAPPTPDAGSPTDAGSVVPDGSLTITATDPSTADQNSIFAAHVTFSQPVNPVSAVDPRNVQVLDASGTPVPGALQYDGTTRTAILIYDTPLSLGARYTLRVSGITNTDAAHLASVTPLSLDFMPLAIRWQVFQDLSGAVSPSSGIDTDPRIVWTPGGVHVISRYVKISPCASSDPSAYASGALYALEVVDGGLAQVPVVSANGDGCVGDWLYKPDARHVLVASGGTAYAVAESGSASDASHLLELAGGGWVERVTDTVLELGFLTDGSNVYVAQADDLANGYLGLRAYLPASVALGPLQSLRFVGDSLQTTPVVGAGSGDDFFIAAIDNAPTGGQAVSLMQRHAGALVPIGVNRDPGWSELDAVQLVELDGRPWVFQCEAGGTITAHATTTPPDGANGPLWDDVNDTLPGDARFQVARLGHTAYVVSASGGLTLHHLFLDDPNLWVADPGPEGNPSFVADLTASNSAPAIAAGRGDLWIAYSQLRTIGGGQQYSTVVVRAY